MKNVRFARVLCALALLSGTSALAQQAFDPLRPLPDPARVQSESGQQSSQPADTREQSVQADVANAPDAEAARAQMAEKFGVDALDPGQFRWAERIPAGGPTKVIVSLTDQLAFVYRGDELIGVTTVSSGMKDHETPTGVFPILAKEKVHHSRTYDNAPMPYMQRLNDYGVALHGGRVPGYPASHGCVRLPLAFAAKLFTLTTPGSHVVIEV